MNKRSSIIYQASMETSTERTIAADHGECLPNLTKQNKLDLLAILALRQATNRSLVEIISTYTHFIDSDVVSILRQLDRNTSQATFDFTVAIANQIRYGDYAP